MKLPSTRLNGSPERESKSSCLSWPGGMLAFTSREPVNDWIDHGGIDKLGMPRGGGCSVPPWPMVSSSLRNMAKQAMQTR